MAYYLRQGGEVMIPQAFEYYAPTTISGAVKLLKKYKDEAKILAGGQSLIPAMKLRLSEVLHLVDLSRVKDLVLIQEQDGELVIGSMTTYSMLDSSVVWEKMPVLAEAASLVADIQVRNKGTIGGSLAHADPAADLPAVILAAEAKIMTAGAGRSRSISADRFFLDIFTTTLRENEVIKEIRMPVLPRGTGSSYHKFANKASHFAIVGVAAFVTLDKAGICDRIRLGITGAGPCAIRAKSAERFLEGKEPSVKNIEEAASRATRGIDFQGDLHASVAYRQHLTKVFVNKALTTAVDRACN